MKKSLSVMLILCLCIGMAMTFTGCGEEQEDAYAGYDLTEYIELADYDAYVIEKPVPEKVTELEMQKGIQKDLSDVGIVYEVKKGVVAKGDTIKISYEGKLADGTAVEGMSAEEYTFTLGEGKMIPGFEEGLYGAEVGDTTKVKVTFPDPYANNRELSGKEAVFEVKILTLRETRLPELTDELIQEVHDGYYRNVDEYMAGVRKYYEELHASEAKEAAKEDLFQRILAETKVLQYPQEKLDVEVAGYITRNAEYAAQNQYDWDTYLKENLQMTNEEFEASAVAYAEEILKREMIVYAIAEKEGLEITEEEYQAGIEAFLTDVAGMTRERFQEDMGMTVEAYAEEYKLERELLYEDLKETLYNKLVEK